MFFVYTNLVYGQSFKYGGAIQGTKWEYANAICRDSYGHMYITGSFAGKVDFDPSEALADTSYMTSYGGEDIFVVKLDKDYNFIWAIQLGGAGDDEGLVICSDPNDNIYVSGSFSDTADFDPGAGVDNLIASGDKDIFVTKLNSGGDLQYVNGIGGTAEEEVTSIAYDNNDNVLYISGKFSGTVDFDPGASVYPLIAKGTDAFIANFENNGDFFNAALITCSGLLATPLIAIDDLHPNHLYFSCSFKDTIDCDPDISEDLHVSKDNYSVFVGRYSPSLILEWSKIIDGTSSTTVKDMYYYDYADKIFVTGGFLDTLNIPGNPVSNGHFDVFLLSLASADGSIDKSDVFGGGDFDCGENLDGFNQEIYLSGIFSDTIIIQKYPYNQYQTIISSDSNFSELFDDDLFVLNYSVDTILYRNWLRAYDAEANNDISYYDGVLTSVGSYKGDIDLNTGTGVYNLPFKWYSDGYIQGIYTDAFDLGKTIDSGKCDEIVFNNRRYDTSGIYKQNFFSYWGNDSTLTLNLTIKNSSDTALNITSCDNYTFNGKFITASGTYFDTLINNADCDSIITLNLEIIKNDVPVAVDPAHPDQLSCDVFNASYYWADCDNDYTLVDGYNDGTNRYFTAAETGNYAAIISKSGCMDTSDCVNVIVEGVEDLLTNSIKIFPNPTNGSVKIDLGMVYSYVQAKLSSADGKAVSSKSVKNTDKIEIEINEVEGVYYIELILDETVSKRFKLIKTK